MKKQLLISLFLSGSLCLFSQNKLTYEYDNSGNRTQRVIPLKSVRNTDEPTTKIQPIIDQSIAKTIKIYPNPTKGRLTIEIMDYLESISGNITIHDLQGRLILTEKITTNNTNLDISDRPSGAYILNIQIDGEISNWKIIKE